MNAFIDCFSGIRIIKIYYVFGSCFQSVLNFCKTVIVVQDLDQVLACRARLWLQERFSAIVIGRRIVLLEIKVPDVIFCVVLV